MAAVSRAMGAAGTTLQVGAWVTTYNITGMDLSNEIINIMMFCSNHFSQQSMTACLRSSTNFTYYQASAIVKRYAFVIIL